MMPGGRRGGICLKWLVQFMMKPYLNFFLHISEDSCTLIWSKNGLRQKNKYRKDISIKGNLKLLFLQFSTQAT